jgi:NAD-dependent SIR2 family protein deacetylase
MIKRKTKLPLEVLLNHLKEYKDAVIILGPDIAKVNVEVTEDSKNSFNRKTMVRKPQEFWSYYAENLMKLYSYNDITTETVESLLDLKLHSNVIDINIIDVLNHTDAIHPAGKNKRLECVRCGKFYNAEEMYHQLKFQDSTLKCSCGGNIKPTVLCFGEKYPMNVYNKVKDAIFSEEKGKVSLNTHTLIFIGVDFSDSLITEIIDSFDALKDANHYTVIIADKEHREDVIYYNPEFGVCDDIQQGVSRLIDLLNK